MNFTELLYQALRSPLGIEVTITEGTPAQVAQRLYAARREACDEELESLSIVQPPSGGLWIVKRKQDNG